MLLFSPRLFRAIRRQRRDARERGAALVEFALIAPLLFTILFGVIEFGWVFSQVLDMRHGAREGARLAAVNYQPTTATAATQTGEIIAEICNRIEEPGVSRVEITFDTSGSSDVGDYATIRVERDLQTLTGFFDSMFSTLTPNSEVSFRLEQPASWAETASLTACP